MALSRSSDNSLTRYDLVFVLICWKVVDICSKIRLTLRDKGKDCAFCLAFESLTMTKKYVKRLIFELQK